MMYCIVLCRIILYVYIRFRTRLSPPTTAAGDDAKTRTINLDIVVVIIIIIIMIQCINSNFNIEWRVVVMYYNIIVYTKKNES